MEEDIQNDARKAAKRQRSKVAADDTGLKTGSAGEYLTYTYGKPRKHKKHVVLVITVDVKRRKLLSADAYIEGRGHSQVKTAVKAIADVREKGKKIRKFYGIDAYDTNLIFLSLKEAESAVKIRTNATTYRSRGCRRRRDEIRRYHALGYKWRGETDYGMRWAVEGFFRMKRKFGEVATARKPQTLTAEAVQRAWAYDTMACYARARTRKGTAGRG
ncbi:MAG: transposase [Thermoprotei archaeon]